MEVGFGMAEVSYIAARIRLRDDTANGRTH